MVDRVPDAVGHGVQHGLGHSAGHVHVVARGRDPMEDDFFLKTLSQVMTHGLEGREGTQEADVLRAERSAEEGTNICEHLNGALVLEVAEHLREGEDAKHVKVME